MADYPSMKVPELKKLLQERGLAATGNKADLIARLQEHDKSQAGESAEPKAEVDSAKPVAPAAAAEDEIDYDDDDYPAFKNGSNPATDATAKAATVAADAPAVEEKKTEEAPAAAETKPAETKPAEETAAEPAAAGDDATKTAEEQPAAPAAPAAPLFTQNLAPTNAQTEAEKRAARAARFGVVVDKESEDAKKAERAARFGQEADVSALDNALPERGPRKRGREGKEDGAKDGSNAAAHPNKRQQPQRNSNNNRNQQQQQQQQQQQPRGGSRNAGGGGGRNNQNQKNNNAGGGRNAQKSGGAKPQQTKSAIDAAEQARREARAKRFG